MAITISTAAELQAINNDLAGDYVVVADIPQGDMATWNGGEGFVPLAGATGSISFTGQLDGQGHTVSIYMDRPGADYQSLFYLIDGVVEDLHIDAEITGNRYSGALAGRGVGAAGRVSKCRFTGSVTDLTATSACSGGVIGISDGGFADTGLIEDCENHIAFAALDATGYVGGFIGYLRDTICRRCYSVGTVDAPLATSNNGGFAGREYSAIYADNFYDSDIAGYSDTTAATPKTTAEMQQQATFVGWDFDTVWQIAEGTGYPELRIFAAVEPTTEQVVAATLQGLFGIEGVSGGPVEQVVYADESGVYQAEQGIYSLETPAGPAGQIVFVLGDAVGPIDQAIYSLGTVAGPLVQALLERASVLAATLQQLYGQESVIGVTRQVVIDQVSGERREVLLFAPLTLQIDLVAEPIMQIDLTADMMMVVTQ